MKKAQPVHKTGGENGNQRQTGSHGGCCYKKTRNLVNEPKTVKVYYYSQSTQTLCHHTNVYVQFCYTNNLN